MSVLVKLKNILLFRSTLSYALHTSQRKILFFIRELVPGALKNFVNP
jgi:hypothetical protein